MKKTLSGVLALCLLCGMLVGCGGNDAKPQNDPTSDPPSAGMDAKTDDVKKPEPQPEPTIYPKNALEVITDAEDLTEPPDTIYTTTAEENGLGGKLYKIQGTVTAYVSEKDTDLGTEYAIVETDKGIIAVLNPMSMLPEDTNGLDIDQTLLKQYFEYPQKDDLVCFYIEYMGYSNALKCAAAAYGGTDYATYAALKSLASTPAVNAGGTPQEKPEAAAPEEPAPEEPKTPASTETIGQKNARAKAKNYLAVSAFSHDGLVDQLEYEGFTTEEATYAADNCGADWNEQAAQKAKKYLEIMSFSRSGLIDQLEYDGFTQEQAEYGVTAAGY